MYFVGKIFRAVKIGLGWLGKERQDSGVDVV